MTAGVRCTLMSDWNEPPTKAEMNNQDYGPLPGRTTHRVKHCKNGVTAIVVRDPETPTFFRPVEQTEWLNDQGELMRLTTYLGTTEIREGDITKDETGQVVVATVSHTEYVSRSDIENVTQRVNVVEVQRGSSLEAPATQEDLILAATKNTVLAGVDSEKEEERTQAEFRWERRNQEYQDKLDKSRELSTPQSRFDEGEQITRRNIEEWYRANPRKSGRTL